ncbi:hypothetical protein HOD29_05165 [archaeon]|jgi:hypothetical protein|nr:hypothetical protein [archaeon]
MKKLISNLAYGTVIILFIVSVLSFCSYPYVELGVLEPSKFVADTFLLCGIFSIPLAWIVAFARVFERKMSGLEHIPKAKLRKMILDINIYYLMGLVSIFLFRGTIFLIKLVFSQVEHVEYFSREGMIHVMGSTYLLLMAYFLSRSIVENSVAKLNKTDLLPPSYRRNIRWSGYSAIGWLLISTITFFAIKAEPERFILFGMGVYCCISSFVFFVWYRRKQKK